MRRFKKTTVVKGDGVLRGGEPGREKEWMCFPRLIKHKNNLKVPRRIVKEEPGPGGEGESWSQKTTLEKDEHHDVATIFGVCGGSSTAKIKVGGGKKPNASVGGWAQTSNVKGQLVSDNLPRMSNGKKSPIVRIGKSGYTFP